MTPPVSQWSKPTTCNSASRSGGLQTADEFKTAAWKAPLLDAYYGLMALDEKEAAKRVVELRTEIAKHNRRYYEEAAPTIKLPANTKYFNPDIFAPEKSCFKRKSRRNYHKESEGNSKVF